MEIRSAQPASPQAGVQKAEPAGRLAALRALQRALETEAEPKIETKLDDGKGRMLDIRC
jgi:hypothetical protein